MYKKSNSFVYIFVLNCQFFPSNYVRLCVKELRQGIDMLYHMNSTFQTTVFQVSVDVPLNVFAFS